MGVNKSINAQLGETYVILNGGITAETELRSRLDGLGFTVLALQDAHELFVRAGGQRIAAFVEHGEQVKATVDLNAQRELVDRQYSQAAQIGKTVFADQPDALDTLDLQTHYATPPAQPGGEPLPPQAVRPSRAQAEVIGRAQRFYSGLLAKPDWVAQMAAVGYNAVRLQKELADVTTLQNADVVQEREKGEAKGATASQKAALAELRAWVKRFKGIVVPALNDRPDLLKALGLKSRGGKR